MTKEEIIDKLMIDEITVEEAKKLITQLDATDEDIKIVLSLVDTVDDAFKQLRAD